MGRAINQCCQSKLWTYGTKLAMEHSLSLLDIIDFSNFSYGLQHSNEKELLPRILQEYKEY